MGQMVEIQPPDTDRDTQQTGTNEIVEGDQLQTGCIGHQFDKEFTRMKKDGGQLFTYFKFSSKADVIILYASELNNNEILYKKYDLIFIRIYFYFLDK